VAWSRKPDDLRFVTIGAKEIKFWNPADSTKKLAQKGIFGEREEQTFFSCAVFDTEGNCYTAGVNGSVYVWDSNNQLRSAFKAHDGEITALAHEQGKLITGGKDKKVAVFTANGQAPETLDKKFELFTENDGDDHDHHEANFAYPRSLDYYNGKVLVGLREGKILEIDATTGDKKLLMTSHHDGEAWGLELIPEEQTILTVGDDNKILAFDYGTRKLKGEGAVHAEGAKHGKEAKVRAATLAEYHSND
jgi:WD40 repeat protein